MSDSLLRAPPIAAPSDPLLRQSAALARVIAPWLCAPHDGDGCRDYHAVWQYLRMLGLTRTLERQRGFYHDTLARLAALGGYRRVLVSGTADHALPTYCAAAYEASDASIDLTVLDRCPTPLAVCQWHAALTGRRLATHAADILRWQHPDASFDVICSHSFLGRFRPEQQPALLGVWHGLLRPGGKLLTATRLQGEHRLAADGRYSEAQIEALRAQVVALAQGIDAGLDLSPEYLGEMAAAYARTMTDHPPRNADMLAAMLENAGLRVDSLVVEESPANARIPVHEHEPPRWPYAMAEATRM